MSANKSRYQYIDKREKGRTCAICGHRKPKAEMVSREYCVDCSTDTTPAPVFPPGSRVLLIGACFLALYIDGIYYRTEHVEPPPPKKRGRGRSPFRRVAALVTPAYVAQGFTVERWPGNDIPMMLGEEKAA